MERALRIMDGLAALLQDATADENVKIVHTFVMCDRRRDLQSIASEVGILLGHNKQSYPTT